MQITYWNFPPVHYEKKKSSYLNGITHRQSFWRLPFPATALTKLFSNLETVKRTVSVISSDPLCKDSNALFTTVPLKPNFNQKWWKKGLFFLSLCRENKIKISSLKKQKHEYLI